MGIGIDVGEGVNNVFVDLVYRVESLATRSVGATAGRHSAVTVEGGGRRRGGKREEGCVGLS